MSPGQEARTFPDVLQEVLVSVVAGVLSTLRGMIADLHANDRVNLLLCRC